MIKIVAPTKGEMIKILKSWGIRTGEKDGAIVKLEHLKFEDICKIFSDFSENINSIESKKWGTGNAEYWHWVLIEEMI